MFKMTGITAWPSSIVSVWERQMLCRETRNYCTVTEDTGEHIFSKYNKYN